MPGKRKRSDDETLQAWMAWYERNQARSEYRRKRYEMLTEEEREDRRVARRADYKRRIAEGWNAPYRKTRHSDNMEYRRIALGFLIARDGRACGICGKDVEDGQESFDHIIPKGLGGPDDPTNIRLAHRTCNNRRPKKPADIRTMMEGNPKHLH